MITKTITTLLFSVLQLIAWAQPSYLVKGDVEGLKDGPIQLVRAFDKEIIHETQSVGGRFEFSRTDFVGEKVFLSQGDLILQFPIYLEPGVILVKGNARSLTATGTISNESHQEFLRREQPINAMIDSLKQLRKNLDGGSTFDRLTEEMNETYRRMYAELRRSIVTDFPGSMLAVEFQSAGIGDFDYYQLKEHISVLDSQVHENWYMNRLRHRLSILERTRIGQVLPDFVMPDPDGRLFRLSSLRGRYVLIDFWASWCAPCRAENVNVKELYKMYHARGFDVVGVSIDQVKDNWLKAIADDELPWHQVSNLVGWKCETSNSMGVAYGMSGVPYTVLIGPDGKVLGHNLRGKALAETLATIFSGEVAGHHR